MELNKYGAIISQQWLWIAEQYNHIILDEWIVMPDHFHAIIRIDYPQSDMGIIVGTGRNLFLQHYKPPPRKHKPLNH